MQPMQRVHAPKSISGFFILNFSYRFLGKISVIDKTGITVKEVLCFTVKLINHFVDMVFVLALNALH
jgi:hypothetical protein